MGGRLGVGRTILFILWATVVTRTGFSGLAFGQELTARTAADQERQKAMIQQMLNDQAEAWNRGNLEQFMDCYWKSDRLTFSAGGTTTRGWQATLDRYKKRYPTAKEMGKLIFSNLETQLLGPNSALVLGHWRLTFEVGTVSAVENSERVKAGRSGNFTLMLHEWNGRWTIVHDHSSEATE
jgi:beta-aspartyl-peptidase (threonine type)